MMNDDNVMRLQYITNAQIEIIKIYAEIEGMKALNKLRESQGLAQAYDEGSFFVIADNLNTFQRDCFY